MSYGSDYYKETVIENGIKMFGKRFFPITNFMTRIDYVKFINEMDIVFMFHNRSQAWGNIATSLALGKPVFLKNNNAIKSFINEIGIETYDANLIQNYDLNSIILNEKRNLNSTVEKLKITISKEARLQDLKKLMTIYAG